MTYKRARDWFKLETQKHKMVRSDLMSKRDASWSLGEASVTFPMQLPKNGSHNSHGWLFLSKFFSSPRYSPISSNRGNNGWMAAGSLAFSDPASRFVEQLGRRSGGWGEKLGAGRRVSSSHATKREPSVGPHTSYCEDVSSFAPR